MEEHFQDFSQLVDILILELAAQRMMFYINA